MAHHHNVAILHGSELVAAGLRAILETSPDPVLNIITLRSDNLHSYLPVRKPLVLFIDPYLADSATITTIRRLCRDTMIAAVSHGPLPADLADRLDASVTIYDTPDTLLQLVRQAHERREAPTRSTDTSGSSPELTPRERQVLIGVVKGLSNKEIASEINISANTVMTHRRNIASKLGIHSTAGLTIYAIVTKLVRLEDLSNLSGSSALTLK